MSVTGWLATCGYSPPQEAVLDIVTPTRNRYADLLEQAERIGQQLGPNDRWIVADDASDQGFIQPIELANKLPTIEQLLFIALTYARGEQTATINRARHAGCSLARSNAWIVEVDDHDLLEPACLGLIRDAITRGATLVYGDVRWYAEGRAGDVYPKGDYVPWTLRDSHCPCEGVRAFPSFLYRAVGGYRWDGEQGAVGGNECPGGDYGLLIRMEALCEAQGLYRIPQVLCRSVKVPGGLSTRWGDKQLAMAKALQEAAQAGRLFA